MTTAAGFEAVDASKVRIIQEELLSLQKYLQITVNDFTAPKEA